ncbi:MAG TPA: BREX system Lon protease-like protein BrxL [Pirellulales bacterium]
MVCFDEVSGVSFDQKDGVNIMKGYMESGEFSPMPPARLDAKDGSASRPTMRCHGEMRVFG